jgi:4-amino-4-deoxy-L-arabinose transferase-like glycosyltransferase
MNSWMKWKNNNLFFFIILGLIFLAHLPFIGADPDRNMAVGRGPFTDEGLNTSQVRNWVNQGELDLKECDNLLKTPLLGFPLAATYKIFGVSHEVSRLHVLVLIFLALLIIGLDKKNRLMMIIFSFITLLQYPVFHSSHYSMAEMLSVAAILLSIHFFSRSVDEIGNSKLGIKYVIFSGAFLSLSYFIKIQFIYILPLFPIVLIIHLYTANYKLRKIIIRHGIILLTSLIVFCVLYILAWYLPHKQAYDYMMAHQSGEFSLSGKFWEHIRFNLGYHFMKGWVQWLVYFFLVLLLVGFLILKKTKSRRYPVLFISSLVWFMLELHKLAMVYLPTRYQVSLFAAMGLLMSVVLTELMGWPIPRTWILARTGAIAVILILTCINVYNYIDTLHNRTYMIRDANKYLAAGLQPGDVVLGAWAPSLTWDSKAKALPVWNNFLNYQDPITKYHPRVIIAETDEQDSEQAWSGHGIDLKALSDSSKTVRVGHWDLVIFWMKQ